MWHGLDVAEVGRETALRHGAALALEVVAGGAVGEEDLAPREIAGLALLLGETRDGVLLRVGVGRVRGPREATKAASCSTSSSEKVHGLTWPWTPGWASGIRPVSTWKCTAAAPTPTSDGP